MLWLAQLADLLVALSWNASSSSYVSTTEYSFLQDIQDWPRLSINCIIFLFLNAYRSTAEPFYAYGQWNRLVWDWDSVRITIQNWDAVIL